MTPDVLVCMNCARPIVFGPNGWVHRDEPSDCVGILVAWPPPGEDDHHDALST